MILKIALRNLLRNKRRTLLAFLIIGLGTAVLFVAKGYVDYSFWGLKLSATYQYGHLQIADPRYWKGTTEGYEHLISQKVLVQLEELLRRQQEVVSFSAQLNFSGLIGTEKKSTVFIAQGIEPKTRLGSVNDLVTQGIKLFPGDKEKVLLGEDLAKNLGVKVGDWLVVMTTTVGGVYNAGNLQVVGLFRTGQAEVDLRLGAVLLAFAQRMLNTNGVEKVIVELSSVEATEKVAVHLQAELAALGLEVKTWSDLATHYHRVRAMFEATFNFMTAAIFFLVFFSILEVLTMSFFERMREIGTIRAVGTKRREVFWLFLGEGLFLGLIGGLVGVALGWGLGWLINSAGLGYVPPGMTMEVPLRVRLALATGGVPFLTAVLSTLISAVYPAFRAARIEITEALRYV